MKFKEHLKLVDKAMNTWPKWKIKSLQKIFKFEIKDNKNIKRKCK